MSLLQRINRALNNINPAIMLGFTIGLFSFIMQDIGEVYFPEVLVIWKGILWLVLIFGLSGLIVLIVVVLIVSGLVTLFYIQDKLLERKYGKGG
jgi:hypothetical protein